MIVITNPHAMKTPSDNKKAIKARLSNVKPPKIVSFYGIVSTGVVGVAFAQANGYEAKGLYQAASVERLHGIFRATRVKSAGWAYERGNQFLICFYDYYGNLFYHLYQYTKGLRICGWDNRSYYVAPQDFSSLKDSRDFFFKS